MYIPDHFRVTDQKKICDFVRQYPLAVMMISSGGVPEFCEIPLIYQVIENDKFILKGHLALANPFLSQLSSDVQVTCIFRGPNAYVSPSYTDMQGVPTWNYTTISIKAVFSKFYEAEELWQQLKQQSVYFDPESGEQWLSKVNSDRRSKLLSAIVGIELNVIELDAKFKLSQNRSVKDREKIIQAIANNGSVSAQQLAEFMELYK